MVAVFPSTMWRMSFRSLLYLGTPVACVTSPHCSNVTNAAVAQPGHHRFCNQEVTKVSRCFVVMASCIGFHFRRKFEHRFIVIFSVMFFELIHKFLASIPKFLKIFRHVTRSLQHWYFVVFFQSERLRRIGRRRPQQLCRRGLQRRRQNTAGASDPYLVVGCGPPGRNPSCFYHYYYYFIIIIAFVAMLSWG